MKKLYLLFIFFLLYTLQLTYSQFYLNDNKYFYFVGYSDPDSGWNILDFDDSGWNEGKNSIGYGDYDDVTLIDTTTSVYIRYKLEITNDYLNQIKALIIYADYDDGFIAYLNGKEILRINIDATLKQPNSSTLTNRSHEAEYYRFPENQYWLYTPVFGFYIDTLILNSCNLGNSNILAFEVHNDSIKGSDLTFNFNYQFIDNNFHYSVTELESRYLRLFSLDSTKLPIISIQTDEYGCDTSDVLASIEVINASNNLYNKPNLIPADYEGIIRLKRRGASSSWYPKRSYKFELRDIVGRDIDIPLLDMPEENDWLLLAFFADKSLIGNEFTLTLGRKMGYYEPRSRYCEFIMNGINQGVYLLTEQIKRSKNRVNIHELNPENNFGIDITGGYIFCPFYGNNINIIYPKPQNITNEQKKYINDLFAEFIDTLNSNSFLNPLYGYKQYIDINSMADYILITEISMNVDAYNNSFYIYKDRDDIDNKIKFGPLWDFDNAYGYGVWIDTLTSGWRFSNSSTIPFTRIMQDTSFANLLSARWFKYRDDILSIESIYSIIDSLVATIGEDTSFNYSVWPLLGVSFTGLEEAANQVFYSDEITRLKNWIKLRIDWIDNNIGNIYYPVNKPNTEGIVINHLKKNTLTCFPNPFLDILNVSLFLESPGNIQIYIIDLTGKIQKEIYCGYLESGISKFTISNSPLNNNSFYIMKVLKDKQIISCQKIIKHTN